MSKRILVIILLLVLLVFILAGCNAKIAKNKPVTFTVLYNNTEDNPYKEDWRILEEYKTEKNVILDFKLGDDADFEKAIDLNFKAEVIPDVILKCWPDTIEGFANEGLLVAISDYEDIMPYYKAYIDENNLQSEIDKLRLSDGKYYIMPGYKSSLQVQQWMYRQDLFEENNLSIPKTYDELFNSLLILKQKNPESTPITASWGGAHLLAMMGAGYGIPAGWSGTRFFNEETNEWQYSPATDNYRELYRFLNKCYTADILDKDIFTQSNEEFREKIINGKALVTVSWITSGFDVLNKKLEDNGILGGKWAALPVLESTIGIKALPPVDRFRKGLVITAQAVNKPYFEDMIKFLDWAVYSKEGINLTYWGIEDLTYKITNEGKEFLPDIQTPKNINGTINIKKKYGFDLIFNLNEDEEFENYKKPDNIVSFLTISNEANETLKSTPKLTLSDDAIDMENIINKDLPEYVTNASRMFITGELNIEEDWYSYLSKIDAIGYTILEQIWNNAWNEQDK